MRAQMNAVAAHVLTWMMPRPFQPSREDKRLQCRSQTCALLRGTNVETPIEIVFREQRTEPNSGARVHAPGRRDETPERWTQMTHWRRSFYSTVGRRGTQEVGKGMGSSTLRRTCATWQGTTYPGDQRKAGAQIDQSGQEIVGRWAELTGAEGGTGQLPGGSCAAGERWLRTEQNSAVYVRALCEFATYSWPI